MLFMLYIEKYLNLYMYINIHCLLLQKYSRVWSRRNVISLYNWVPLGKMDSLRVVSLTVVLSRNVTPDINRGWPVSTWKEREWMGVKEKGTRAEKDGKRETRRVSIYRWIYRYIPYCLYLSHESNPHPHIALNDQPLPQQNTNHTWHHIQHTHKYQSLHHKYQHIVHKRTKCPQNPH